MRFGLKNVRPVGALHWSNMRLAFAKMRSTPAPFAVDYLKYLPSDLGMMLNDSAGCCFWSAQFHGRQIRTLMTTGVMDTQPDSSIAKAYASTGWDGTPGDATDQGTDAAQGFSWIQKNGLPLSDGSTVKLWTAIEVDPRHPEDCVDAMDYCGGLNVGLTFPQRIINLMNGGTIPKVWDWQSGDTLSNEGHEVLVAALDTALTAPIGLISWGAKDYTMTADFWKNCVQQVTATVYEDWFKPGTNLSPFNMTEDQLAAEIARYQSGQIP